MTLDLEATLRAAGMVPVLTVERAADAVPLARALVAGGLPAIEITLRTPAALEAIRAVAAEVPEAVLGVGTVLRPADLEAGARAGARFFVSPGSTAGLLRAAAGMAFLPGVATASEAIAALEAGFRVQKFFPVEPLGGPAVLAALHGPLPEILFCPTGSIRFDKLEGYFRLANLVAVGGTWVAPADAIRAGDWARITALARQTREAIDRLRPR